MITVYVPQGIRARHRMWLLYNSKTVSSYSWHHRINTWNRIKDMSSLELETLSSNPPSTKCNPASGFDVNFRGHGHVSHHLQYFNMRLDRLAFQTSYIVESMSSKKLKTFLRYPPIWRTLRRLSTRSSSTLYRGRPVCPVYSTGQSCSNRGSLRALVAFW